MTPEEEKTVADLNDRIHELLSKSQSMDGVPAEANQNWPWTRLVKSKRPIRNEKLKTLVRLVCGEIGVKWAKGEEVKVAYNIQRLFEECESLDHDISNG